MIQVKRDRTKNGKPIRPSARWFKRAADVTIAAKAEGKDHEHDSNIYGHNDLRRPLLELFYQKCAYCEMGISGGFPWEVEHFRPKGRVAERDDHPGYYWLTYEWDNLYTSCTFCNQRRGDRGTWEDPQESAPAGKLDQFPLSDESQRAMSHNESIVKEEPVRQLIDPCKENPETVITFGLNGEVVSLNEGEKGNKTIKVLNFNRRDRQEVRRGRIAFLQILIEGLPDESNTDTSRSSAREKFLDAFSDDSRPYAGLARAIKRDPGAFGF